MYFIEKPSQSIELRTEFYDEQSSLIKSRVLSKVLGMLSHLRDCSLFMPKGGSVIFKQFRHMKNLPLPGSGYFKKLPPPPVYVTGPKCNPLPPPPSPQDATCLRLRNCVQHVFWPVADKPKSIAIDFCIKRRRISECSVLCQKLPCSMMMRLSPVLKDLI